MSILYNLQEYLIQDKSISIENAIDEIKKRRKLRISKARRNKYQSTHLYQNTI
jgi:hypothetical protein